MEEAKRDAISWQKQVSTGNILGVSEMTEMTALLTSSVNRYNSTIHVKEKSHSKWLRADLSL